MVINFIRINTSCCNIDRTKFLFITYNKNIYIKVLGIIEQSFPVHLIKLDLQFLVRNTETEIHNEKKKKNKNTSI